MNIIIAGTSALEYWAGLAVRPRTGELRLPLTHRLKEYGLRRTSMCTVPGGVPSARELGVLLDRLLPPLARPINLLVGAPGARQFRPGQATTLWKRPLPPRALVRVGGSVFVATPEFAFLHAVRGRSYASALRLTFEVCARYVRSVIDARGFRDADPLASPADLDAFLADASAGGDRGGEHLRQIVARTTAGAASPMEVLLTARLCAPRTQGGFNLPLPELNGRVGNPSEPRCARCDLLWRKQRLAVEYDSDAFHTGSDRIAHDSVRRNLLLDHGYAVITVTRRQFFDDRAFCEVAGQITRALGVRPSRRQHTYNWDARFMELRRELLAPEKPWSPLI